MRSYSPTRSCVRATRLTQSVGRPWCPASCKTPSPPIGSPSWWDTRMPRQPLALIVYPWCQANCPQELPAPLNWGARKAQSGPRLRCRCLKLLLRWVCFILHTSQNTSGKSAWMSLEFSLAGTYFNLSIFDRKRWRPAASPVHSLPKTRTWWPVLISSTLPSVQWVYYMQFVHVVMEHHPTHYAWSPFLANSFTCVMFVRLSGGSPWCLLSTTPLKTAAT